MLKLTCQDKDKVSLILPVLPSGAPLYIVFFPSVTVFRRHLVLPSLYLLLMLLFVSVLDPNFPGFFFSFLFIFFFLI